MCIFFMEIQIHHPYLTRQEDEEKNNVFRSIRRAGAFGASQKEGQQSG